MVRTQSRPSTATIAWMSAPEIADQLFLSHRTVGVHLYNAYPKLGVSNRAQLVDLIQVDAG